MLNAPATLTRLGSLVVRRPLVVVALWVVLAVVGWLLATTPLAGASLFDRLSSAESSVPGSQSAQGEKILADGARNGADVVLLVTGMGPDEVDDVALSTARLRIAGLPGVTTVLDPVSLASSAAPGAATHLTAASGDGFLVITTLRPGLTDAQTSSTQQVVDDQLARLGSRLVTGHPGATAHVGSSALINESITRQAAHDLGVGTLVALPVALLIMLLVFGGLVAATMPLLGAIASLGAGLGALLALSHLLDVHVTVVNVATCLGLGLAIDYGLLMVSRFRDELVQHARTTLPDGDVAAGPSPLAPTPVASFAPAPLLASVGPDGSVTLRDVVPRVAGAPEEPPVAPPPAARPRPALAEVRTAVVRTVETAGRTVAFSALTIAVCVAGLVTFSIPTLRAMGVAGVAIVVVALLASLTLVPAVLVLVGHRVVGAPGPRRPRWLGAVLRRTADTTTDDGAFSRLAVRVQRRPWWVLGGAVAVLLVLAAPVLGATLRTSGIELLPTSSPQRVFLSTLTTQYPSTVAPQVKVVAQTDTAHATALATTIGALPGVEAVSAPSSVGTNYVIGVHVTGADPGGATATAVVERVRGLSPGFPTWTVGQASTQLDTSAALRSGAVWAVLVVVLATVAVLFAMTGSLVVPLQALVTNTLSLAAALGLLTWVFQDPARAGWFGAASTGGIETSVMTVVVAFAFGLAMDYEVFLLARIVELRDEGVPLDVAIGRGLQRSGRIITSAAAVIVVVFAGFAFGQILVIKQVGFALAVAVLIDATIVRMLLVPAIMTLLGRWNWWAPRALRDLRERLVGRPATTALPEVAAGSPRTRPSVTADS